jgi:hypothetical protein
LETPDSPQLAPAEEFDDNKLSHLPLVSSMIQPAPLRNLDSLKEELV